MVINNKTLRILGAGGVALLVLSLLVLFLSSPVLPTVLAITGSLFGLFLVWIGTGRTPTVSSPEPPLPETAPTAPQPAERAAPPRAAISPDQGEAEVVQLLTLLQEKGRFIDFLQEDVTLYSDEQVGAAARVFHQGCQTVLEEFIQVEPVHPGKEGAVVKLPKGFSVLDYRISGDPTDAPPSRGRLLHAGWKVARLTLPRLSRSEGGDWPPVAPAQVEIE